MTRISFLATCLGLMFGTDHYLNRPQHSAFQIKPTTEPRLLGALPEDVRQDKKRRDKLARQRKAKSKKKRGY